MRQHKFRAWDKVEKEMVYDLDAYETYLGSDRIVILNHDINCNRYELEPLEWTGLKDKNGKEIYEGDIVKVYPEGFIYEIYYNKNKLSYWIRVIKEGWISQINHLKSFKELEVVGNKFQNPELLRGVQNA